MKNLKIPNQYNLCLATGIVCLAMLLGCSSTRKKANPQINKENSTTVSRPEGAVTLKIVSRSDWNAAAAKPFKKHELKRITIHHEGSLFADGKDAARHIKNVQVWGMGKDRNWSDIPYHFLIARDGTIYEGRDVYTAGETATEYDPTGHLLISCLGDLDKQEMPERQLNALIGLIVHVAKQYNIPYDTLASHKDYAHTNCPGKNLYHYLQNGYILRHVRAQAK